MDEEKKKKAVQEKSRGASDDFEAIKILLDSMPSLKQRVLHKLRELQNKEKEKEIKVTSQELRESQRNQMQKEKLKR